MDKIVTFLVVLELMKTGVICAVQEHVEDDIQIQVKKTDGQELENLRLTSLSEGGGEAGAEDTDERMDGDGA